MRFEKFTTVDGNWIVVIDPENGTEPFRTEVETFEDAQYEEAMYHKVRFVKPQLNGNEELN